MPIPPMMPPRKRQHPFATDSNASDITSVQPESSSMRSPTSEAQAAHDSQAQELPPTQPISKKHIRNSRSWYGSWPRAPKASASTSVTQETIFGGSVKSSRPSDLERFDSRKADDTASLQTNATSVTEQRQDDEPKLSNISQETLANEETFPTAEIEPNKDEQDADEGSYEPTETASTPKTGSEHLHNQQQGAHNTSWLGWWAKPQSDETQVDSEAHITKSDIQTSVQSKNDQGNPGDRVPVASTNPSQGDPSATVLQPTTTRPASWFGFWPGSADTMKFDPKDEAPKETRSEPDHHKDEDASMEDTSDQSVQTSQPQPKPGSTWGFWSKDTSKEKQKTVKLKSGEIAVIGEGSEAHPKPIAEGDVTNRPDKDQKDDSKAQPKPKTSWRKSKVLRNQSSDTDSPQASLDGTSTPDVDQAPTVNGEANGQPTTASAMPQQGKKTLAESETPATSTANLLLPSFSSTYRMKDNPSILQQITQLLLRTSQAPPDHVFRVKDPPKIRKAIAIGVHGLFPAMYLRPMIGQPTGTSLRFAGLCADAIRRWADNHGCSDCEIERVALEGEGKINDRVDNLWKLMLNWIEHIRDADLVVIACHSQGVPVSILLLEKLIELGIITNAKVGVCAMAGVALGPFPDYKSGILMGSAAELWEFGNPQSSNSQRFEAALKRVLDHGARITFIGSIDDQVVPLESAVYSPASHPHIYRAVFIDGRVHAPDFIAHLVGFALKLRNLGISDHGLIRELSIPLAGSLYSGEGHSRLYFDDAVYDLAISHALETTAAPHATAGTDGSHFRAEARETLAAPNPYVLPWTMRGLLEEDFVKTELSSETEELLRKFDDWKPSNKALKDVKYRLEAVRSKL